MDFNELQQRVTSNFSKSLERDAIKTNNDYFLVKIGEEVGELMQAYLVYTKQCRPEKYLADEEAKKALAKELADVVGLAFMIAKVLGVDLQEAIEKKWITKEWISENKP